MSSPRLGPAPQRGPSTPADAAGTTDQTGKAKTHLVSDTEGEQVVMATIAEDTGAVEPAEVDECDRAAGDPTGAPAGQCQDSVTITWTDASIDPRCDDPGVICGTDGDDVLVGTAGDDLIIRGDGNDTVEAMGGDDTVSVATATTRSMAAGAVTTSTARGAMTPSPVVEETTRPLVVPARTASWAERARSRTARSSGRVPGTDEGPSPGVPLGVLYR